MKCAFFKLSVVLILLLPVELSSQVVVLDHDTNEPIIDFSLVSDTVIDEDELLTPGVILTKGIRVKSFGYQTLVLLKGTSVPDTIFLSLIANNIPAVEIADSRISCEYKSEYKGPSLRHVCNPGNNGNAYLIPLGDTCYWRTLLLEDVGVSDANHRDSVAYRLWLIRMDSSFSSLDILDSSTVVAVKKGWGARVDHYLNIEPLMHRRYALRYEHFGVLLLPLDYVDLKGGFSSDERFTTCVNMKGLSIYRLYTESLEMYGALCYTLFTSEIE